MTEHEMLLLEIQELTELLHQEWDDLREHLRKAGVDLQGAQMAGFIEGEAGGEYGALLLGNRRIVVFESNGGTMTTTEAENPEDFFSDFPALRVAVEPEK